jgi:hypothetical protein
MKHILLLTLLAGCPTGDTGAGTLTATWSMLKGDGTPDACPTGAYHTMRVSAAGFVDDFPNTHETPTVGLFDCGAGSGTIELAGGPDYTGIYAVWFEIGDEAGNYTIMKDHHVTRDDSEKLRVDLESGSATAHMPFYPNAGRLNFQWELYATQVMQRLTSCEAGGVDRIEIELENEAMVKTTLTSPCTGDNDGFELGDHMIGGLWKPMPSGDYIVTAKAFSGGAVVSLPRDPNTSGGDLVVHVGDKNAIGGAGLDLELTTR